MKIIAPPQINGLDELLEVIIHPERLVATLQQLQTMRDSIIANLSLYQTKQQADEYLAQAQQTMHQAKATQAEVEALKRRTAQEDMVMRSELSEIKAAQAETEAQLHTKSKELQQTEKDLNARAHLVSARADELDAREKALREANERLMRQQAVMAEEVEKMERRIAAFRDIA
jgi:chromosome segregation ATPase